MMADGNVTGNDDDNKENVMSVNEEHVKDKTRKIYALKTFGSHQQPALEKIEFKVCTLLLQYILS